MKQEDKDILLKDLCARAPYGVKCQCYDGRITATLTGVKSDTELYFYEFDWKEDDGIMDVECCKPYLFPRSSMTEEQRNIISNKIKEIQINNPPFGKIHNSGTDNLLNNITLCAQWLINYYIENHFDYNGLIEKGLALDATGLNIY